MPASCRRLAGLALVLAFFALVPAAIPASEDDWYQEYLGPILAVRVVKDLEAAIAHINRYGSQHTDAIVSTDYGRTRRFVSAVDPLPEPLRGPWQDRYHLLEPRTGVDRQQDAATLEQLRRLGY